MEISDEFLRIFKLNGEAFGGKKLPSYERGREIWEATIHRDAIWDGPTFEKPVYFVGYEANAAFNEFLLSVVPGYDMRATRVHKVANPSELILEITGFGHTVDGGTYEQQYFSLLRIEDGKIALAREFCNPFQTYKAFGKQRWEDAIDEISKLNIELPEKARA